MVSKVAIINLTLERFPRVKIFDFLFKVEGEVSSEVNFVYCWRWMMLPVDHSMIRTFSGGTEWIWSTLKIFLHQRTDICRRKGEFLTQRKWLCVFCVLSTWVVLVGFSPAKEPFRLRRNGRFAGQTRNFWRKNLTSLALKIQNSELPSLIGGAARTAAESKGFHQTGPQALRNGR